MLRICTRGNKGIWIWIWTVTSFFSYRHYLLKWSQRSCHPSLYVKQSYPSIPGAVYFGDCPRQPLIPHYLIVAGTLFFIRNLSSMFQRCRNQLQGTQEENSKRNYVDSGLSFVITIWFFVGMLKGCILTERLSKPASRLSQWQIIKFACRWVNARRRNSSALARCYCIHIPSILCNISMG